jgi:plasmid maintenance system antidote protein VapI
MSDPRATLPLAPCAHGEASRSQRWPTTRDGLMRAFLTSGDGRRFTATQLAREAGVNPKTVYNTMRGATKCTLEVGLKLARALARTPWWLVEYTHRIRALGKSTRPMRWSRKKAVQTWKETV